LPIKLKVQTGDMVANSAKASLSIIGLINISISVLVAIATYATLALIARKFGASNGSDAYFYLLSLTTVTSALIGSVLSAVFLPVFIDLKVRYGLPDALDFGGVILSWTLVLGVLVGALVYLAHDSFFGLISKFDAMKLKQQRDILLFFGPLFFFTVLGEYFRLLLIALGRYTVAAFSALITPSLLVAVLLFSDQFLQEQVLAMTLFIARVAVLTYLVCICVNSGVRLRFTLVKSQQLIHFLKTAAPYGVAGFVTHFATFFFDYMATGLAAGVLTSVTYAQRVFALPLTLVVTPLLEIARVRFSEYRAGERMQSFQRQYDQLSKVVIYFSIPTAVVFYLFPEQIISMLFQRGAFTDKEVAISAACLKIFAFSIPLSCFFTLSGRVVESFQRLLWPSFFGTIGNVCLIITTFNLVDSLGFLGIPYARLMIDVAYFLPMGIIAIVTFGVRFDLLRQAYSMAVAGFACSIPVFMGWGLQPSIAVHLSDPVAYFFVLISLFLLCYVLAILIVDRDFRRLLHEKIKRRK
jgi:putative peptidoglycan lipid II flippase